MLVEIWRLSSAVTALVNLSLDPILLQNRLVFFVSCYCLLAYLILVWASLALFFNVVVDCICSVTLQLYSPKRPAVDVAEVFLWLMAVGTILCASYWSAWTVREEAIEQDKLLKVIAGNQNFILWTFTMVEPFDGPRKNEVLSLILLLLILTAGWIR